MSRVMLIAADKPLPLCDKQEERTTIVTLPCLDKLGNMSGQNVSVTATRGFFVEEHSYYRCAVDALHQIMKPYQYEVHLECCEPDLSHLRTYLSNCFCPGEEVELWNLWVGDDNLGRPIQYYGSLAEFDLDSLSQFLMPPYEDGGIGQCCMNITV